MNIIKLEDLNEKLAKPFSMKILDELLILKKSKSTTMTIKDSRLKNKIKSVVRYEGWSQKELTIIELPIKMTIALMEALGISEAVDSKLYTFIPMKLDVLILEMSRIERLKAFI